VSSIRNIIDKSGGSAMQIRGSFGKNESLYKTPFQAKVKDGDIVFSDNEIGTGLNVNDSVDLRIKGPVTLLIHGNDVDSYDFTDFSSNDVKNFTVSSGKNSFRAKVDNEDGTLTLSNKENKSESPIEITLSQLLNTKFFNENERNAISNVFNSLDNINRICLNIFVSDLNEISGNDKSQPTIELGVDFEEDGISQTFSYLKGTDMEKTYQNFEYSVKTKTGRDIITKTYQI
jgi:hypothetical protein